MSDAVHPGDDRIQAALDGRLEARELAALDGHLRACADCLATREALAWVKTSLRASGTPEAPGDLATAVRRRLGTTRGGAERGGRRGFFGLAAAATLVGIATLLYRSRRRELPRRNLPDLLASDFADYRSGALPLTLETRDAPELERLFKEAGLPFQARVFDLTMMGHTLAGGRPHAVAGRPSALFAYYDSRGRPLVCQMFPGAPGELPEPLARHEENGFSFSAHARGAVTVVVWAEGAILCALAAERSRAELLPLAVAKAMRSV